MKATFTKIDTIKLVDDTVAGVGIALEPETDDEQLLLEMFAKGAASYEFNFHGWEMNGRGRALHQDLTQARGSLKPMIVKATAADGGGLGDLVANAACERIRAVADEAFGPFRVQSTDEAITAIERGIASLRAEQPLRPLRPSSSTVDSAKADAERAVAAFNAGASSAIIVASHVPALIARIDDLEIVVADRGGSFKTVKAEYNAVSAELAALRNGSAAPSPTVGPVSKLAGELANRPGITSQGMGALSLDVEMARKHGWSNEQIAAAFVGMTALVHQAHRDVAIARGFNYICPACECWTDAPPKPCHLCAADQEAIEKRRADRAHYVPPTPPPTHDGTVFGMAADDPRAATAAAEATAALYPKTAAQMADKRRGDLDESIERMVAEWDRLPDGAAIGIDLVGITLSAMAVDAVIAAVFNLRHEITHTAPDVATARARAPSPRRAAIEAGLDGALDSLSNRWTDGATYSFVEAAELVVKLWRDASAKIGRKIPA